MVETHKRKTKNTVITKITLTISNAEHIKQNRTYYPSNLYIAVIGNFAPFCSLTSHLDLDLDPMTFTYELDPWAIP